MRSNSLSELSDEKLLKRRDLLKGATIGLGTIAILVLSAFIYIFLKKGFDNIPIATLIPVMALPATFCPLLVVLNLLNKEIKSRNQK